MKPITLFLLATAALAANTARADHDNRITVNGYVHVGVPAPVYTAPAYYPPAPVRYGHEHGYWSDVVVKTWISERWTTGSDRWGRPVRFCEPGHFIYRTERVWVDGRRGYGYRDEPRYNYGYRR